MALLPMHPNGTQQHITTNLYSHCNPLLLFLPLWWTQGQISFKFLNGIIIRYNSYIKVSNVQIMKSNDETTHSGAAGNETKTTDWHDVLHDPKPFTSKKCYKKLTEEAFTQHLFQLKTNFFGNCFYIWGFESTNFSKWVAILL